MRWIAELKVVWIVGNKRAPGRVAIGEPELVADGDGDGEAICPIALDGLQQVTRVRGEGEFHALMQGVHSLDVQLRNLVAKGVRVVLVGPDGPGDPDEAEDPELDTASLLEMFKPFGSSAGSDKG